MLRFAASIGLASMLIKPWQKLPRTVEVAVRTTVAAIAGALLATLGMAVVQTRMNTQGQPPAATPAAWTGLPGQAQPVGLSTSGLSTVAPVAPAVMRCAPGQQAVLSQTMVDGRVVTSADCAWDTSAASNYGFGARPLPVTDIVEYQPRARAVRYEQDEPVRRVVRTAPRRSWQKSALVIGGSAGAGAGIGALAGGKKGALIGAAIGGGAGSIFEAFKRR
jgi:hypothetical protein